MDLVRACDGLSPLPVEEKTISWTLCAFAMAFPPCLSRKRPSHGLGVRLRWPFPPACRGKGYFKAPLGCSRLTFPSACREKGLYGSGRNQQNQSEHVLFLVPVDEKGSMGPAETS